LITIIEIASNTSSVFDKKLLRQVSQGHEQRCIIATFVRWLKRNTSNENRGNPKYNGLKKDIRQKKTQSQNTMGSIRKTSDEKRGNSKM
jgi:hypothetical protein